MNKLFYAGVGSRETPIRVRGQMTALASYLTKHGWVLRSGAADGADTAFETGCNLVDSNKKQIILPWKGFNGSDSKLYLSWAFRPAILLEAEAIAALVHPVWDKLSPPQKKLHTRNVFQVLGPTLVEPVKFVVCWTKNGKPTGGTATAINLAKSRGIPVFNMGAGFYFHGVGIYD